MCLIVFAHEIHPEFPLVLAANRDEFHARPTAALTAWGDAPGVFGGRDLEAGGSWLAVSEGGRWAAVTNYREPAEVIPQPGRRSRGELVADFARGAYEPRSYIDELRPHLGQFSGFNLLAGTPGAVYWLSNRAEPAEGRALAPGIYGVSNHLLDTPWPKVERGKRALASLLDSSASPDPTDLLEILLDRAYAADHELPNSAVSLDLERALSALFISLPEYGTRSSTALLIDRHGGTRIAERRYGSDGSVTGETTLEV